MSRMPLAGTAGRMLRPLIDQFKNIAKTNVPINQRTSNSESASLRRHISAIAIKIIHTPAQHNIENCMIKSQSMLLLSNVWKLRTVVKYFNKKIKNNINIPPVATIHFRQKIGE